MIDPALLIPLVVGATLLSWFATRHFIGVAVRTGLLDIPNARSSHRTPMPRGGGVAFVGAFVLVMSYAALRGLVQPGELTALAASLLIAAIGMLDDAKNISPGVRIVVHVAAATWSILWLLRSSSTEFLTGPALVLLVAAAILFVVWSINFTNFMDGIDGFAASQAVSVGAVCAAASFYTGDGSAALVWLALAAAVAGFLLWNWPPARIFMGDSGSGFIGCVFAIATLLGASHRLSALWPPLIMMNVFLTDATSTLIRRILRQEQWYAPHRQHAYQVAAQRWGHRTVVQFALIINLSWLTPLALLSAKFPLAGPGLFLFSGIPLLYLQARMARLSQHEPPVSA